MMSETSFQIAAEAICLPIVGSQFPTDRIAAAAMECLRKSHYKVLRRVSCESRHGILILRGRLFSHHEKQIASQAVAGVKGVIRVVNEIEVV
jgi:osmotically-inducible protein OsmY